MTQRTDWRGILLSRETIPPEEIDPHVLMRTSESAYWLVDEVNERNRRRAKRRNSKRKAEQEEEEDEEEKDEEIPTIDFVMRVDAKRFPPVPSPVVFSQRASSCFDAPTEASRWEYALPDEREILSYEIRVLPKDLNQAEAIFKSLIKELCNPEVKERIAPLGFAEWCETENLDDYVSTKCHFKDYRYFLHSISHLADTSPLAAIFIIQSVMPYCYSFDPIPPSKTSTDEDEKAAAGDEDGSAPTKTAKTKTKPQRHPAAKRKSNKLKKRGAEELEDEGRDDDNDEEEGESDDVYGGGDDEDNDEEGDPEGFLLSFEGMLDRAKRRRKRLAFWNAFGLRYMLFDLLLELVDAYPLMRRREALAKYAYALYFRAARNQAVVKYRRSQVMARSPSYVSNFATMRPTDGRGLADVWATLPHIRAGEYPARRNRAESEQFLWSVNYCCLMEMAVILSSSSSATNSAVKGYRQLGKNALPLVVGELTLGALEGLHNSNSNPESSHSRFPPTKPYLRPSRSLIVHAPPPSSSPPSSLLDFLVCEICFGRLNPIDPPITYGDGVSVCRSCFQRKRNLESHGENNCLESWAWEMDRLSLTRFRSKFHSVDDYDHTPLEEAEEDEAEENHRIVKMRDVDDMGDRDSLEEAFEDAKVDYSLQKALAVLFDPKSDSPDRKKSSPALDNSSYSEYLYLKRKASEVGKKIEKLDDVGAALTAQHVILNFLASFSTPPNSPVERMEERMRASVYSNMSLLHAIKLRMLREARRQAKSSSAGEENERVFSLVEEEEDDVEGEEEERAKNEALDYARRAIRASEGRWARAHFRYYEVLGEILGFSELERLGKFATVLVKIARNEGGKTIERRRKYDVEQALHALRWKTRKSEMLDYCASLLRANALGLYVDSRVEGMIVSTIVADVEAQFDRFREEELEIPPGTSLDEWWRFPQPLSTASTCFSPDKRDALKQSSLLMLLFAKLIEYDVRDEMVSSSFVSSSVTGSEAASERASVVEMDMSLLPRADFDCTLCYSLLYEPVTLPCSHSFCRACLIRTMDYALLDSGDAKCPMCRASVNEFAAALNMKSFYLHKKLAGVEFGGVAAPLDLRSRSLYPPLPEFRPVFDLGYLHCRVNVALSKLIEYAFREELEERKRTVATEEAPIDPSIFNGDDNDDLNNILLPIVFYSYPVVPYPCTPRGIPLDFYETGNRLLIRRLIGFQDFGGFLSRPSAPPPPPPSAASSTSSPNQDAIASMRFLVVWRRADPLTEDDRGRPHIGIYDEEDDDADNDGESDKGISQAKLNMMRVAVGGLRLPATLVEIVRTHQAGVDEMLTVWVRGLRAGYVTEPFTERDGYRVGRFFASPGGAEDHYHLEPSSSGGGETGNRRRIQKAEYYLNRVKGTSYGREYMRLIWMIELERRRRNHREPESGRRDYFLAKLRASLLDPPAETTTGDQTVEVPLSTRMNLDDPSFARPGVGTTSGNAEITTDSIFEIPSVLQQLERLGEVMVGEVLVNDDELLFMEREHAAIARDTMLMATGFSRSRRQQYEENEAETGPLSPPENLNTIDQVLDHFLDRMHRRREAYDAKRKVAAFRDRTAVLAGLDVEDMMMLALENLREDRLKMSDEGGGHLSPLYTRTKLTFPDCRACLPLFLAERLCFTAEMLEYLVFRLETFAKRMVFVLRVATTATSPDSTPDQGPPSFPTLGFRSFNWMRNTRCEAMIKLFYPLFYPKFKQEMRRYQARFGHDDDDDEGADEGEEDEEEVDSDHGPSNPHVRTVFIPATGGFGGPPSGPFLNPTSRNQESELNNMLTAMLGEYVRQQMGTEAFEEFNRSISATLSAAAASTSAAPGSAGNVGRGTTTEGKEEEEEENDDEADDDDAENLD